MKLFLAAILSISLNSAFESGTCDPELLFPYARAVQDTSSPVIVINPAMIPFCGGFTASASGGRPFSGYGLDSAQAAVQYGNPCLGLSARWNSFGDSSYRENSFCAGAALMPAEWFAAGMTGDLYRLSIDCGETVYSDTLYGFGAGFILAPCKWLETGFMIKNINAFFHEQDSIYGEWSCGILANPCSGLSFSWNLTDNPAGRINTFVVTVNPLSCISSGFGYSVETSSFSMDLGLMFGHLEFNYGLRIHPYLGYSHAVSITFATGAVTEPLAYGKTSNPVVKRINIQTATYDELTDLGILSDTSARRIILYREQAGPLSRDALARIGLTPSEIRMLVSSARGFEKSPRTDSRTAAKKTGKKDTYVPRRVLAKRRFREMIDEGIPAYQAALYSDMCVSATDDLHENLSGDATLGDDQKKVIRDICGR